MLKGDKTGLAKRRRRNPSYTEAGLWNLLRGRKCEGLKFRRETPMGRYVADFVCDAHRLVVEADGRFHDPVKDAERDAWFHSQGYLVLRFPNSLINSRPELVLQDIAAAAKARPQRRYPD